MIGGSSPGRGWEFFSSPSRQDRLWGPPSFLYSGYRGSFPGGKASGSEADHSPPPSVEVKECVELYIHFLNTPSWRGAQLKTQGQLYPLPLFCTTYEFSFHAFLVVSRDFKNGWISVLEVIISAPIL
jgi:hypothetical protein